VRAKCCDLVMVFERISSLYLGVLAPWSLRTLSASLRPSGLVWSSDDGFVRGTRRPLLRGKLRSEGDIKVTEDLA
jgi:hypothetical protein